MGSTQTTNEQPIHRPNIAPVDQKLEVVVIAVSDGDRAKRFYEGLGWRLDADFVSGNGWRWCRRHLPVPRDPSCLEGDGESAMAVASRSLRNTTGRTGTAHTSLRASAGAHLTMRRQMPRSMWNAAAIASVDR